ncbi:endonuclease [Rhizobium leguminosarum]|uniref:Z1 domain-containing protein n=1 Tax=Rhizobium ruizarguesonis TaxID=2081791 RepID=UPI0010398EE4|nr:Z1 domain-containing protein [Rhizobium ruizarguesonis]MBY5807644.1 Z1 domain-containing protein [Rhizobium leguminosarum]TCB12995.1 endonuclease [Rhizobium leguminosarum bv. viciae]MBY5848222.1 Z1 domain-containing protein [Rhizobium leguminosarum]NEH88633.1 endonuclease [Rhizobium ruizarguesonis]NEI17596.1 endonuclease [Rhizobium ruizarguesonis]
MNENYENLRTAVEPFIAKSAMPTPDTIRSWISQFRQVPDCQVDDAGAERLARELEAQHGVSMKIGSVLIDKEWTPWLESEKPMMDRFYWMRYRRLLVEKRFSGQVLATLDSVTDRILGLMENPKKDGVWDRRGMVVGHVQSGKTANYTGLICKAADAGYKLIIVIAGIHNNLRNQTQLRIDEGFVGRDSARLGSSRGDRIIGVGRYDSSRHPWTFTTSVRDFNSTGAGQGGGNLDSLSVPAVFVIKKNSSTLRILLEWLEGYNRRRGAKTISAPMLVIDDEADNASINIKHGKGAVSNINGQIRSLLKLFDRSCYIGYTATPFANIFIDPDSADEMRGADLFPRNFIVSLDPPSNYFGANRVFLEHPKQIIRHIEDHEEVLPLKHPRDTAITTLPDSLVRAIRAFIVARAIRLVRGQRSAHNSMLVNASRFTDVQQQLRNEIHDRLEAMKASISVNGAQSEREALRDPEIRAFHEVWREEYSLTSETEWSDVQAALHESAAPVNVVEVNSRSAGNLAYADHENTGLNVIAVGGFSLSRGLTLEGLIVSYFLRNSMMYDTLMQMGRWFGYRPGYDDLCRVWMPEEAEGWYAHVAESIDELRDELRRMEAANATPEQFGLKVRSHPDTLLVTAKNKMGSSERLVVSIGLANSFVETAILLRDEDKLKLNLAAAKNLAGNLQKEGFPLTAAATVTGGRLLAGAPVGPVLQFLGEFQNHEGALLTDGDPIQRYITKRADDELKTWDILFAAVERGDEDTEDHSLGIKLFRQRRTAGKQSTKKTLHITNKQRVASRGVEATGLTSTEISQAREDYREKLEEDGKLPADGTPINFPDRIYRAVRSRPLLVVHLLRVDPEGEKVADDPQPVVAYSISFPTTANEEDTVEYVVNTTWIREHFRDEGDEEEMAGDDQ